MAKVSMKKREYEETLNKLFGVKIKWSKLSLSELEELATSIIEDNDKLCAEICKPESSIAMLIDKVIPPEEQGPVIRLLKVLLKGSK